MQNLFGQALAEILLCNKIAKGDFAAASTINRNHVTNIITGLTRSPAKIAEIFIGLQALGVPRGDIIRLVILWLEDRRTDAGFTSAEITIHKTFGNGVSSLPARDQLISLYDQNADIRTAFDIIVQSILEADAQPAAAAERETAPPQQPHPPAEKVTYKTPAQAKRAKRKDS